MTTIDTRADRLDAAIAAVLALRPSVEAAGPWAPAELYGVEAEASWGPPEVLAHLEEMLPFWLGEVERILDAPSTSPAPFGRVAADAVRIGIIGRDRTLPLRELFARVGADGSRLTARMRALKAAELEREGEHPRLGVMTVGALLDRFVVTHTEEHVAQLRDILTARGA
ncbi:MAG: DinB family protein [Chloroflexota bacterium]